MKKSSCFCQAQQANSSSFHTGPPAMLPTLSSASRPLLYDLAAWILMAIGLGLVLWAGLLGALLAGMAVYTITHALAKRLPDRLDSLGGRKVALALVATVLAGGLTLGGVWMTSFFSGYGSGPGLSALILRMADILAELKQLLPLWATENWPSGVHNFNQWAADLLKSHAGDVQALSQDVIKGLTRILIGMVLGGMVAVAQVGSTTSEKAPLAYALSGRLIRFATVFGQVVSAQVKISALNTFFTAIFLGVVLPLTGNALPFTKTMILLTFVVGLIPVLGNLISNTVITIIALSVSVWVAVAALAFLIVIHKVEYFLNAKIIGGQVQAKAWELLSAMLVMEACFGIAGVIAAPIYYAYIKRELRDRNLI